MPQQTRKDRLRGTKRRRQMGRRVFKIVASIGAIIGILAAAGYGAWQVPDVQSRMKSVLSWGRAGGYEFSPEYEQVGFGKQFEFSGGKVVIDAVRTSEDVKSVFGGGFGNEPTQTFEPKRGTWLLLMVTFEGGPYAESGTMDPEAVKLVDEDGNIYPNQEGGRPAEDLYYETSTTAFGKMVLTDRRPQKSLLIFDVPTRARGLLLAFLREEDGVPKIVRGAKLSLTNEGE